MRLDYEAQCDLAAVEDPAHAWNALTVGGFTERRRSRGIGVVSRSPSW